MRIVTFFTSGFIAVGLSSAANAQAVTGEIGVTTKYLDDNFLTYGEGPAVQVSLDVEVGEGWTFGAWGSHGEQADGAELDLRISKKFNLGDAEIEVAAEQEFLRESDDITTASVAVTYGPIDVEATYHGWKQKDVFRISAGYSVPVTNNFTIHPQVTYETDGFEAPNFTVGTSAEFELSDKFSLRGLALTDGQNVKAAVGVFFTF